MDELYLENIDEYVHDQNKIVTYKWLSFTLGVHVNQAKQMLYHYLDQKRKESSASRLHATYLVSGKFTQNGSTSHKVAVVREDQLEDVKSKMVTPASVHVYSVQRAVLKDSGPLFSTDYDTVKENLKNCSKYSAIQCANAVPMSSAEILRVQAAAQGTPPASEGQQAASKPALNGHSAPTSKPASQQPKGIMGMFTAKSSPKSQEANTEVKMEVKEDTGAGSITVLDNVDVVDTDFLQAEVPKNKSTSKSNSMSNFFGKAAASKATSSTSTEKTEKVIKEEVGGAPQSSAVDEKPSSSRPDKPVMEIKEEKPKSSGNMARKSKDSKSKTKRLEVSDSEDEKFESQKKKRRRIKKPQLDSSDDEVIPDSPACVVETPTPSPEAQVKKEPISHAEDAVGAKRRKRRKVMKSSTFMDDEGCIVTEKRFESESFSESEDDLKSSKQPPKQLACLKPATGKKEEEKKSQKKSAAASNKVIKQVSIMGFFQKK